MRTFVLPILFCLILIKANAQHKVNIPEFKNINPDDKYPERSVLSSYTVNFDILISLKGYSAWGGDHSIKILAHQISGWWKIEINTDPHFISNTTCYSIDKLNDSIGDVLWNDLKQNHLSNMKDGRQIGISCITTDTIRYKNGKFRIDSIFHDSSSDGAEYEFEIFTKKDYKKLYFYSPQELVYACPDPERKWIINCINVFEKYLGK